MIFSENRLPPSDQVRRQAFSGLSSKRPRLPYPFVHHLCLPVVNDRGAGNRASRDARSHPPIDFVASIPRRRCMREILLTGLAALTFLSSGTLGKRVDAMPFAMT